MPDINGQIVDFIRKIYSHDRFIPLHEPRFIGNEIKYLTECIESTFVSSVGKFVDSFENEVQQFVGCKKAISVVNGTEALFLALHITGVKSGDEVITQPLTFVATANAISYTGASPVFIDVDKETLGMSSVALEQFLEQDTIMKENGFLFNRHTNKRISACVPMHTFGHPCEIDKISSLCKTNNIPLIEDAAESLGSFFDHKHTGTIGRLGILSFNGNKVLTTGGGGMLLTDDVSLGSLAKHLTTQAKVPHKWEFNHDMTGFNLRMPNINAALGLAQLENLPLFIQKKRDLACAYISFFGELGVNFVREPQNCKSNYWLNTIILEDREARDSFLEFSNNHGVMTRPAWTLMNKLPMYRSAYCNDLSNAQFLEDRIVNIPSSVVL